MKSILKLFSVLLLLTIPLLSQSQTKIQPDCSVTLQPQSGTALSAQFDNRPQSSSTGVPCSEWILVSSATTANASFTVTVQKAQDNGTSGCSGCSWSTFASLTLSAEGIITATKSVADYVRINLSAISGGTVSASLFGWRADQSTTGGGGGSGGCAVSTFADGSVVFIHPAGVCDQDNAKLTYFTTSAVNNLTITDSESGLPPFLQGYVGRANLLTAAGSQSAGYGYEIVQTTANTGGAAIYLATLNNATGTHEIVGFEADVYRDLASPGWSYIAGFESFPDSLATNTNSGDFVAGFFSETENDGGLLNKMADFVGGTPLVMGTAPAVLAALYSLPHTGGVVNSAVYSLLASDESGETIVRSVSQTANLLDLLDSDGITKLAYFDNNAKGFFPNVNDAGLTASAPVTADASKNLASGSYHGNTTQFQVYDAAQTMIGLAPYDAAGNLTSNLTGASCVYSTTSGSLPQCSSTLPTLPSLSLTNCASGASPAVCGASAAGSVAIPTGVNPTLVVDTTAVTANSEILLTLDDTRGTALSVTCNSTLATITGGIGISARTAGTSFTLSFNGTVTTNPVCVNYVILN